MARNAPSITSDGLSICNEHENEHEGTRTARQSADNDKKGCTIIQASTCTLCAFY